MVVPSSWEMLGMVNNCRYWPLNYWMLLLVMLHDAMGHRSTRVFDGFLR